MEWGSLFCGLKIEWEVVFCSIDDLYRHLSVQGYHLATKFEHTYEMMCKANSKACSIGFMAEQAKGHYWIACESTFIEEKQHSHQSTNHDKADDLRRIPGVRCTSKVKTKQHHNHEAYDRKAPSPVDGFDTFGELGLRVMHV